jgi:hypothetical protein
MKSLALFAIVVSVYTLGFGQDGEFYYWYRGEKQPLQLKPDKTFLLFDHQMDERSLSDKLHVDKAKIERIKKLEPRKSSKQSGTPRNNHWAIVKSEPERLNLSAPGIIYHAPFFTGAHGRELGLSHLFYVKLRAQEDQKTLETLADQHRVEILHNNKFRPLWYTLACSRKSTGNTLTMANLFYETGLFAAAQPDLMATALIHTDDPFYGDQWSLGNTGQYGGTSGEDIQATDAWAISKSHSGIAIAVNDEGVDLNHPDLPNMHSFSYDTYSDSSPSQIHGGHGTAVSGIAAGNTDNNEGVAGIAPQSQIMSISNDFWNSPGIDDDLADGIDQAWSNGASVINNSWGGGSFNQNIDDAIDSAVNRGRGGLGTVVIFSTGNWDDGSISYPSSNSNVIAVGATSMCAERKSYGSCDTEQWGSNYGTGLDVMAPGVLIPTTDLQSTDGYNPNVPIHPYWNSGTLASDDYTDDNYTTWFNGTSAAAPHVTGIAALVLSINSSLTVQDVRDAIEISAEKVGGYTYTINTGERSDLTWNSEMGYGRVNAYRALIYTIENHGAHLGVEMSQVRLPLYDDLTLQEDVTLESGSNLTIEAESDISIAAGGSASASLASGTRLTIASGAAVGIAATSGKVVIGGSGILAKAAARGIAGQPEISRPSRALSLQAGIVRMARMTDGVEVTLRLPEEASVWIEAYDPSGRQVNLHKQAQRMPAGTHAVRLSLSQNNRGILYLRVKAGNKIYRGVVPPL